jgi:hypothetical protein
MSILGCAGKNRGWEAVSIVANQNLEYEKAKSLLTKVMDESRHERLLYIETRIKKDKYELVGQLTKRSMITGGVAMQDKIIPIYFDSLNEIKVQKRSPSVVIICIYVNERLVSQFITNEHGLEDFTSAIETLKHYFNLSS